MKSQKGFTLIEAVVCLVILCVMSVYAYPEVGEWKSKSHLKAQTAALVSELHRARCAAIKRNAHVVFQYNKSGYKFFVDNGEGSGIKDDWIHQPGEQLLHEVTFDNGIEIVVPESSFTLSRTRFSGRAGVKAGSVVISNGGLKNKVIVNIVGRIRTVKV